MPADHADGPAPAPGRARGFVHHACLYGSDEDFLAMALPFVRAGLAAEEPVLAATTPANIDLLRRALGERAYALDTAETAYFGRRPVERVSAFLRYHDRRARPGRRMRMIAEPVWGGRSDRQIAEWQRMESGLNVLLAALPVWMICPYDTRVVSPAVAEAACATHPACLKGERLTPCASYTDPGVYAEAVRPAPVAAPPTAAVAGPAGRVADVRRFARERAAAAGLAGERLALAELAVCEAANHLLGAGGARLALRAWEEPGAVLYELTRPEPSGAPVPPFAGFRPPGDAPGAEDGLWLARSLSEWLDVRTAGPATLITLRVAGPRDAEWL
ncbi:MEDS domain-containing protein [Streptomyces sp. HU2014]|uniref:MEDS domain-containing protein n=1 Tax=Streptomyces sp. HU2014 TaxID=2939414 RepID=UPI0024B3B642|nr:MEDS domain-containing protein [Streptomyces sp. HU2014]